MKEIKELEKEPCSSIETVSQFTIDRNKWLRGEGSESSTLLRPSDGKMCCLGLYLLQVGVEKEAIANTDSPAELSLIMYDKLPAWLMSEKYLDSKECLELMKNNDNEHLTPEEREAVIIQGFAQAGITVKFEG